MIPARKASDDTAWGHPQKYLRRIHDRVFAYFKTGCADLGRSVSDLTLGNEEFTPQ